MTEDLILIVGDDPTIPGLLKRWIVNAFEVEVWHARDGLEALERLAERPASVVITDLSMKHLSGLELISLIRNDPKLSHTGVIAIASRATRDNVQALLQLGVADLVLKPLNFHNVVPRVETALEYARQRRKENSGSSMRRLPAVLVADADANFRDFAQSALARSFEVHSVRNVGQLLVEAIRAKPSLILLSPNLPGLKLDFVVDKIRSLSNGSRPLIHLLTEDGGAALEDENLLDGAVQRTYAAGPFRGRIEQILGSEALHDAAGWAHEIETNAAGGIHLVLSSLTGEDPAETGTPPDGSTFSAGGRVLLECQETGSSVEVMVAMEPPVLRELSQAAGRGETPEEGDATLKKLLRMLGGRIAASCGESDIHLAPGPVLLGTATPGAPHGEPLLESTRFLAWREDRLIRTTVRIAAARSEALAF
jgi:DNA-binding response OmpR family regulator